MLARASILLGATLACLVLVVRCEDYAFEKKAITKLNQYLVFATGPNVEHLAANVEQAITKHKSGYGLFGGALRLAMGKFLTVTSAQSCTLELADAMGFLLIDEDNQTRVNKILDQSYWTEEMRNKCAHSLGDLASEFDSQLPQDDAMQTYLRRVVYDQPPGQRLKSKQQFDPLNSESYGLLFSSETNEEAPVVVDELVAIAEDKSIVLATSKFDKVAGKIVSSRYEYRYNDLLFNHYLEPCKRHSSLGANLIRFIEFLRRKGTRLATVPEQVKNLYYRTETCRRYKSFETTTPGFRGRIETRVFEKYSKLHPAV